MKERFAGGFQRMLDGKVMALQPLFAARRTKAPRSLPAASNAAPTGVKSYFFGVDRRCLVHSGVSLTFLRIESNGQSICPQLIKFSAIQSPRYKSPCPQRRQRPLRPVHRFLCANECRRQQLISSASSLQASVQRSWEIPSSCLRCQCGYKEKPGNKDQAPESS